MAKRRANGEGSIYQRKDGKWCSQYIDCFGAKKYFYGKTQQEVKKKLQEAIRQSNDGIALNPRKITVSAWVKEWLDTFQRPVIRESTYSYNLTRWRTHIEPYFSHIQLKDLRAEHVQRFLNEKATKRQDGRRGGYSASTVSLLYSALRCSLEKAVELGYIPKNPANSVQIRAREMAKKRILSLSEQQAFENCVKGDLSQWYNSSIFLLMLYTGMRVGEALGLQLSDVDLSKMEIKVCRTVGSIENTAGKGKKLYISSPKTKAGQRVIPLSETAAELLAAQIDKRNETVEQMRPIWQERGKTLDFADAGYIYLTDGGRLIDHPNLVRKLKQLCKKAGIEYVTPHALRHSFATRWIEAGLDVRTLSDILGHRDVRMTLNIYTHALPEQKRKNMDALDAWLKR